MPSTRSAWAKKRSTVAGRVRPAVPRRERVILGRGALAVERRRHGRAGELGELQQLFRGARVERGLTRHDHGPFGCEQRVRRLRHVLGG